MSIYAYTYSRNLSRLIQTIFLLINHYDWFIHRFYFSESTLVFCLKHIEMNTASVFIGRRLKLGWVIFVEFVTVQLKITLFSRVSSKLCLIVIWMDTDRPNFIRLPRTNPNIVPNIIPRRFIVYFFKLYYLMVRYSFIIIFLVLS